MQREALRLATALDEVLGELDRLAEELAAAEAALRCEAGDARLADRFGWRAALDGRRVLCVGSRPSTWPALRHWVQGAGGQLLRHGASFGPQAASLRAAIAQADLVVYPLDVIDPEAAGWLAALCAARPVPLRALRSASVASFLAGVGASDATARPRCPRG